MSKYRISPGDISTTRAATSNAADGLSKHPLSGYVSSAASAWANSGAIVPAPNGVFQDESTTVSNIGTHIAPCLTGAAAATTGYVHGDLDTMHTYQHNAAKGIVSKMPKDR